MKRRFKMNHKRYIDRIIGPTGALLKPCDDNGELCFSWEQVYCLAKATGLKSNKKRHIIKRFRLVMHEAIDELLKIHKA